MAYLVSIVIRTETACRVAPLVEGDLPHAYVAVHLILAPVVPAGDIVGVERRRSVLYS